MSHDFLPTTTRGQEIDVLTSFLKSVIPVSNGIYVSLPITSGRRYLNWIALHNSNREYSGDRQTPEFIRNVIEPNIKHAKVVVKKVRDSFPRRTVIDPSEVSSLPDWSQNDYRFAWGRIIESFCSAAVFTNDWQYSSGCVYEFLIAKTHGVEVLNEGLQEISISEGCELIRKATELLASWNIGYSLHEAVRSELGRINNQ